MSTSTSRSASRAVVLFTLSHPNAVKHALLEQVVMSAPHLPVVVLFDGTQQEYLTIAHEYQRMHHWRRHRTELVTVVEAPIALFTQALKIQVPNGICPGKETAAQWCAASGYDFCWHMEDDVYVHNMSALEFAYRNSSVDLLSHSVSTNHPFWVRPPDVGRATTGLGFSDRAHLLLDAPPETLRFCALAIYRMSSAFAQALVRTALDEGSLSMCELWYPYLIYEHSHLSMAAMRPEHTRETGLNSGQLCSEFLGLQEARRTFMAHPVKYFRQVSSQLVGGVGETHQQCEMRAQREGALRYSNETGR